MRSSRCIAPALLLSALFTACTATAQQLPASVAADMILHNGKIVTVNKAFDVKQAIALRGDRIVDVGSNQEIMALAGPNSKIIDLKGKTVIPGLIDDHYHYLSKAVDQFLGVEVALAPSIKEMVRRIGEKAKTVPPGTLIYTSSGWMWEQFAEKRTPTRQDLDPVTPNNPVIVVGGHSIYLNSYALKQAGITRDTVAPEGGGIEKDPRTGEPTGRLIENAGRLADRQQMGKATHEQKVAALKDAQPKLNAVGITSVRDPGIPAADMRVYQELHDKGEMTVRVSMNYSISPSAPTEQLIKDLETWGVATRFGDHWLRLDGVGEFGLDGGFEAGLMTEHYLTTPGNEKPEEYFGLQRIPTDKFTKVMEAMARLGWRSTVHIVGDKGLDIALDAYENANKAKSIVDKRWVLEHGHFTRPDQFQRMKNLGMVISTQFHPYMAHISMQEFWGKERAGNAMRMRDWLDAGLIVGGGSDWSLVPANPFWMIYFWTTRNTRLGTVAGKHQAISREEALRVMTTNNAYITFEEDVKGSLERGKLADLVVLDQDILTVPEARIRDILPLATVVGGKVVYQKAGAEVMLQ